MRKARLAALLTVVVAAACTDSVLRPEIDPQLAKNGEKGVVASATGNGVIMGSTRHFQFSAKVHADGKVTGRWNLTVEGPGNFSARGDVVCLTVEGNRAWIGTTITDSSDETYVDTGGGFSVEDHGEGSGATDRMSLTFVGGGPLLAQWVCDKTPPLPTGPFEFAMFDVEHGNIQVR